MNKSESTINKIATATTKSILKTKQEFEESSERSPQTASRIPLRVKVKFDHQVTERDQQTTPLKATKKPKYTSLETESEACRNFEKIGPVGSLEFLSYKQGDSCDNLLLNSSTSESATNLIENWTSDATSISTELLSINLTIDPLKNVKLSKFDILEAGPSHASNEYHTKLPENTQVARNTCFLEKLAAFNKRLEDIECSLGTNTTFVPAKQGSQALIPETSEVFDQHISQPYEKLPQRPDEATCNPFNALPNNKDDTSQTFWKPSEVLTYWKQVAHDYTAGLLKVDLKPVEKLSNDLRILDEEIKNVRNNFTHPLDEVQFQNPIVPNNLSLGKKPWHSHSSQNLILTYYGNFDATGNTKTLDDSDFTEEAPLLIEQESQQQIPRNFELNKKLSSGFYIHFAKHDKKESQSTDKRSTEQEPDNSLSQESIDQIKLLLANEKCITKQESSESIPESSSPEKQDSNSNGFKDFDDIEPISQLTSSSICANNFSLRKTSIESGCKFKEIEKDTNISSNAIKAISSKTKKLHFDQEAYLQSGDRVFCYSTELTATAKRFPLSYHESDRKSTQFVKSLKLLAAEKYIQQGQGILEFETSTGQYDITRSEKIEAYTLTDYLKSTTGTIFERQEKTNSKTEITQDTTLAKPLKSTCSISFESQYKPESRTLHSQGNTVTEHLNDYFGASSTNQYKPESIPLKSQGNTLAETLKSTFDASSESQYKSEGKTLKDKENVLIEPLKLTFGASSESQWKPNNKTTKTEDNTSTKPSGSCSISAENQYKSNSKSLDSVNKGFLSELNNELIYQLKECGGTSRTNISKIKPGPEENVLKRQVYQDIPSKSLSPNKSTLKVQQGIEKILPKIPNQVTSKPPQDKQESSVRNKVSFSLKEEVVKNYQKPSEGKLGTEVASPTKRNRSLQKDAVTNNSCLKSQKELVKKNLEVTVSGPLQTIHESEKSGESISRKSEKTINKDSVLKSLTGNRSQVEEKSLNKPNLKVNTPSKFEEQPASQQKKVGKVAAQNPIPSKGAIGRKPEEHSYVCNKIALKLEGGVKNQKAVIEAIKGNSPTAVFFTSENKSSSSASDSTKDLTEILQELSEAFAKSAEQFKETAKNIVKAPKSAVTKGTSKTRLKPTTGANSCFSNKVITKELVKNQKATESDYLPEFSTAWKKIKNISVPQKDKTKGLSKPASQVKPSDVPTIVLKTPIKPATASNPLARTVTKSSTSAGNHKFNKTNNSKINHQLDTVTKKPPTAEKESKPSSAPSKPKKIVIALPENTPNLCSKSLSHFNRAGNTNGENPTKTNSQTKLKKPGPPKTPDANNTHSLEVKQKSSSHVRKIAETRSEPSASSSDSKKLLSVALKEATQIRAKSATHIKQAGKGVVNFCKRAADVHTKVTSDSSSNSSNVVKVKTRPLSSPKKLTECTEEPGTVKPSKGAVGSPTKTAPEAKLKSKSGANSLLYCKPNSNSNNVAALKTRSSSPTSQIILQEADYRNFLPKEGYTATFLVKVGSRSIQPIAKPLVVTKTLSEAQDTFREQFEVAKAKAANSFDKARKLVANVVNLARSQSDSIAAEIGALNDIINKATEKLEIGFVTDKSNLEAFIQHTKEEVNAVIRSAIMGRCKDVQNDKQHCDNVCEKSKPSSRAEFREQIQKGFDDAKAKAKETVESTLQHINEAIDKAKYHAETALDQAMAVKANAGKSVKEAKQQMHKEFDEVYSQANKTAKKTIQQIEETIDSVKERTLAQARGVKESAAEAKEELQRRLEEMKCRAEESVEQAKCELNEIINNVRVKSEQALEGAKKRTEKVVKCYKTPEK